MTQSLTLTVSIAIFFTAAVKKLRSSPELDHSNQDII